MDLTLFMMSEFFNFMSSVEKVEVNLRRLIIGTGFQRYEYALV